MSRRLALGLDYGTESARALLVDVTTGEELAVSVERYPHGVIDESLPGSNVALPPSWALQDAADYLYVLRKIVPEVMVSAHASAEEVVGIGLDFTACTLVPVRNDGSLLSDDPVLRNRPHAWTKLWKHHGAADEAEQINAIAAKRNEPFLSRYGGKTSSEWLLAKAWQMLREAPEIYERTDLFVEAADWLTWQLTGHFSRNACCAGYKGLWSRSDGFPSEAFLRSLDPQLTGLRQEKLRGEVLPVGSRAGELSEVIARQIGLNAGTPVAVGIIDAHAAVAAAGVTAPGPMVIILGTSTCHMTLGDAERLFPGVAGVVQDGIIPGYSGYEAGQSATGDIYAWFVENCVPARYEREAEKTGIGIHEFLERKAAALLPGETGLLAMDWWNGNRSVLMDSSLSGFLMGLTLDTRAEEIYRALLEATTFGTRVILDNFALNGMPISELIACGGVAEKNDLLMQLHADICNRPIRVVRSGQACALGAALFGAVAAGAAGGGYDTVEEAASHMGGLRERSFLPQPENSAIYQTLFKDYLALHDHFGRGDSDLMRRLRTLKHEQWSRRRGVPAKIELNPIKRTVTRGIEASSEPEE